MPTLKEFNKKLVSLRNTRKMTKTMKMVSATKFHRALEAQRTGRQFEEEWRRCVARLALAGDAEGHPLVTPRTPPSSAMVVVVSSDRGLCGSFNNGLHRAVVAWMAANAGRYQRLDVSCCGHQAFAYFRSRMPVRRHYEGVTARPNFAEASKIGAEFVSLFLDRRYDEVFVAYNRCLNALSQKPVVERLLPIEWEAGGAAAPGLRADILFEPGHKEVMELLLPRTVMLKLFFVLVENAVGEHGARMTAMDSATQNADRMIRHYALRRNRARQASITKEMIEIVTGAEALK